MCVDESATGLSSNEARSKAPVVVTTAKVLPSNRHVLIPCPVHINVCGSETALSLTLYRIRSPSFETIAKMISRSHDLCIILKKLK